MMGCTFLYSFVCKYTFGDLGDLGDLGEVAILYGEGGECINIKRRF